MLLISLCTLGCLVMYISNTCTSLASRTQTKIYQDNLTCVFTLKENPAGCLKSHVLSSSESHLVWRDFSKMDCGLHWKKHTHTFRWAWLDHSWGWRLAVQLQKQACPSCGISVSRFDLKSGSFARLPVKETRRQGKRDDLGRIRSQGPRMVVSYKAVFSYVVHKKR